MTPARTALLLALPLILTACASVNGDTMQPIHIETRNDDAVSIRWAICELTNEHGSYHVSPPATIKVRRSAGDLTIICTRDGFSDAHGTAISRPDYSMLGNMLIGSVIDKKRGAGYEYPKLLHMTFGQTLIFEHKDEKR